MGEVIIRYIDLPCSAKGLVREDADGDYNIYINARLPVDVQENTLRHELNHIEKNDFNPDKRIEDIEPIYQNSKAANCG